MAATKEVGNSVFSIVSVGVFGLFPRRMIVGPMTTAEKAMTAS
jgi:hypothetical protein